jgi:hypothetical protein
VQQAPGIPCALDWGGRFFNGSGAWRGENAMACLDTVIASAAKQSIAPRKERKDCFVAALLAMTTQLFEN